MHPLFAAFLAVVFWGVSFVVSKALVTLAAAMVLLGESATLLTIGGGVLVLVGVYLVQRH
jgi:drug/metabolite transporter (DMT)-like permease